MAKRGVRKNPKLAKENKEAFIKDSIVDLKNQLESLEDIDLDEGVLNSINKYYQKFFDDKYYIGNWADISKKETSERLNAKIKAISDLEKELKDKHGIIIAEHARESIDYMAIDALTQSKKIRPYMLDNQADSLIVDKMGSAYDSISNYTSSYYRDMFREFETKSPVVSRSDYLKRLLLANISFAKSQGIDKIVIPNYKEIARIRASSISEAMETEAGSEIAKKYEKAKQKGSEEERKFAIDYYERVFKKTYEDSLRKVINELNKESKGTIKVGTRDLMYTGEGAGGGGERTTAGTQLDISNFKFNPQKEELRFNEGGLVKKPGLMQRLS